MSLEMNKVEEKAIAITPEKFLKMVYETSENEGIDVMDAILLVCEDNFLDPTDISGLIDANLKGRLEAVAMERNMLPKKITLTDFM